MRSPLRHVIAAAAVLITAGVAWAWIAADHRGAVERNSTLSGGDTGVLGVAVAIVLAVISWWWWAGTAERGRRDAIASTAGAGTGRWSTLAQIVQREDMDLLGVRPPRQPSGDHRPQVPYAGRHLLDGLLREALTLHRFVLVHGPSTAGKSRSTVQAAVSLYGDRPVVVPERTPADLDRLLYADAIPPGALVWLDDLDRHLDDHGGALTADVLTRLLTLDGVRVVATIRAAAYEQYKPHGDLHQAGQDVIDMATRIDFTDWDPTDRQAAATQLATYSDIVAALDKGLGLGEYLSAGPELIKRLETGTPPPEGVAVVRAAGDWYRAGMTRPIPESTLRRLYRHYLPPDDRTLLEHFDSGLAWACEPVFGSRLIIDHTDGTGLSVHDYVLDHLAAQPPGLPSITWSLLASELSNRPDDLVKIGLDAYVIHHETQTAEKVLAAAAAVGHTGAMFNLGVLLDEQGRPEEAETWLRKGADTGDSDAMNNLGVLLAEQGRPEEAETWLRKGADAAHADMMFNLGTLLAKQDRPEDAETWYRRAINAGHIGAIHNLGLLLARQDRPEEAETWLRKAADTGDTGAMYNLGTLLAEQDPTEAEAWFRKAIDAGDTDTMNNLGTLLTKQGRPEEAETWYREAADAGHAGAMFNLGVVLLEQHRPEEAETWLRKAINAGHTGAMNNLGVLLDVQDRSEEAETWLRKAADVGDTGAMNNFGALLAEQGRPEEAETWLRKAADAGDTGAMNNLGALLDVQDRSEEAEIWLRKAADTGAIFNLGALLAAEDRKAGGQLK